MTLAPVKTIASGVHDYARSVMRGEIVTGNLVQRACERHLRDLEDGSERGIHFDENAAEHALKFFEFLKQSDGEWAGQPLELQPWQVFIVGSMFGWMKADGTRRFKVAYQEVARKNGKSTMAAGVAMYLTFFDGEGRSEVYSAATTRDQAKIVFDTAGRMHRMMEPELRQQITAYKGSLFSDDGSAFKPLSSDYNSLHGLNIHGAVIDEFHAHKNRHLNDVIDTATGARRQPLLYYITTAGHDRNSVCYELHDHGIKILEGILNDDSMFVYIATLDEGDDWTDETNWFKANPNLGVSVKLDDLKRKGERAQQIPAQQNAFRNLHCNEWTEQAVRWMDMSRWDECGEPIDIESLRGRACYAGVDLSTKIDISAVVLLFPPRDDTERWVCLPYFYVPEENIRKRADRDRVPYDVWRSDGFIHATEGNVVDFRAIRNQIRDMSENEGFLIQQIAFDPWNATEFATEIQEMGFKVVEVRQGARSLSEPMKLLEALVLEKQITHGGNPVLRWMASNIAVRSDPNENIAPDKEKSSERIDGIVALIMAMSRAIAEVEQGPSIYESRGVIVL